MLILGLTGGIATGKSTVSRTLREAGAKVWDADAASRKVVEPGQPGNEALRNAFGDSFFCDDGSLDRKALAKAVFADPQKVLTLNQVLHPYILQDMCLALASFRKEGTVIAVVDAPLLFESGADEVCDQIWMTSCGVDEQIRRLRLRDGMDEEEALARIDAQMTESERRRRVTRVIDTTDSMEEVARYVQTLYEELEEEESQRMGKNTHV